VTGRVEKINVALRWSMLVFRRLRDLANSTAIASLEICAWMVFAWKPFVQPTIPLFVV
jgi:hypothetical protein